MPGFRSADGPKAVEQLVPAYVAQYPSKFWWFVTNGYSPHTWQILFHGAQQPDGTLAQRRHLSAGRRGGKTLSAAWEVAFYALHPQQFHLDAHGVESDEPLWIWVLSKSYKTVRIPLLAFLGVLRKLGLKKGTDFEYNKSERIIEFPDGTLVEFKTADDPDNLRGPGLDILWIDESAMLPDAEPWDVIRPALADKGGRLITTTTPKGKNWYWEEFWHRRANDPKSFRVEYTSIDNPYFPRDEWEDAKRYYHPLLFKQEYLGSFDAMAGVALSGEWLHYYVIGDGALEDIEDVQLRFENGRHNLRTFMAIDPATGEGEDDFAMVLIGLEQDNSQAYILKTFKKKIPFPDQIDAIMEWAVKYRPQLIGVEATAFQRAIVQQLQRMPGMPNAIPVFTRGKKEQRILAMSPVFKTGRVRVHRRQRDFIDQWVSYDPQESKPKDDLLDATEIALGVAGIILPYTDPGEDHFNEEFFNAGRTLEELVRADQESFGKNEHYDPDLGAEFG